MQMLRRLAKLAVLVVLGAYLAGCCIAPHGWGHERGGYERGGYGERR
jgi:hypothetical protein